MRGCRQALNLASTVPVTKHRQLARLKTTFSDEKFFLIAIKKLRLKRSLSWGYKLRKRIVLVLLTTVDLRITCCVTRQYLFRIHFFASQRLSESPAYLYNYIYLLLSSFFFSQIQVFRRSLSLSIKIIYDQVLRDKKKEPAMFWSANFPRLPDNLHIF